MTTLLTVELHPLASYPMTLYVVVCSGITNMAAPDSPVLQRYVAAPDAVNVAADPSHIKLEPLIVTVGLSKTTTVTESLRIQFSELVTFTL